MWKIVQGDSLTVLQTLTERPTLIVTDPPYLIPRTEGGGTVNNGQACSLKKSLNGDGGLWDELKAGYDIRTFAQLVNHLQEGNINAYFFCNKLQIPEYLQAYVAELKCKFDLLCWHKTDSPPTYSNKYLPDTEYILFFHKGKGHTFPKSYEKAKTYWVQPSNRADKKMYEHPTIKPLNIVQTLVANSSEPGELVLDPFCGSGTIGEACELLGRDFIGIEISEKYAEIARKRIENCKNRLL